MGNCDYHSGFIVHSGGRISCQPLLPEEQKNCALYADFDSDLGHTPFPHLAFFPADPGLTRDFLQAETTLKRSG